MAKEKDEKDERAEDAEEEATSPADADETAEASDHDDDADDDDADDVDADDDDADDDDSDDDDADDDDADDDLDEDDDDPAAAAEPVASEPTAKKKTTAKRASKKRSAKPSSTKKASTKKASTTKSSKSSSKKTGAKRATAKRRGARKKGSPTRNVILFVALVGGLAAAFALLGSSGGGSQGPVNRPKWKVGETKEVEITLVTTDYKNLACAMKGEVAGKYCAFEAQNKKSTKPSNAREAENLLQPYTTIDRVQFMASGLWVQPELKAKLDKENWDRPSPRFTVKCKFAVEGTSKNAFVQWKPGEGWHPGSDWYVGSVDDCHISK